MDDTQGKGDVVARLRSVQSSIVAAAQEAGRDPGLVTLVVVTKTFEESAVQPLLVAGHRVFGENRVQEAAGKWPALRGRFSGIELHLIGPLQSNKAADAVRLFDVIQTIDRPKIAEAIAAEMQRQGRRPRLFVQVNTGEEAQKAGVAPREVVTFVRNCRERLGLAIEGLMCIPPVEDIPAPHFAFLSKLARECGVEGLSMGMSADFEAAVSLGATHVRVGSAILGSR